MNRAGPREIIEECCPIQGVERAESDVGAAGCQATRRLVLCMEDLNQCRTSQRGKSLVSREVLFCSLMYSQCWVIVGPSIGIFDILLEGMTVELSHSDSQNSLLDCCTQIIHSGGTIATPACKGESPPGLSIGFSFQTPGIHY